jgi:thioredoxin-related protein
MKSKMRHIHVKNLITLILITLSTFSSFAKAPQDGINWTSIDKAVAEAKATGKSFIFVDLFTDWCGWCKKMDENTFNDPAIIAALNQSFTSVKFNAEMTEPLVFNGKTYTFTKTGSRGANQLALDLGTVGGKLGYPTLVVLDVNGNKLQSFPGFKDVSTLNMVLNFFKSGAYKNMDFQQYQSGQ